MIARCALALIIALAAVAPLPSSAQNGNAPANCTAAQLQLVADDSGDGGMSRGAATLVLTNIGTDACLVPGRPVVALLAADGSTIVPPTSVTPPRFMHPGPVIVPRKLAPGASIRTTIAWLRDNGSSTHNNCAAIARVALGDVTAPLRALDCGEDTAGAQPGVTVAPYDATR